jgi:hypothetical protein
MKLKAIILSLVMEHLVFNKLGDEKNRVKKYFLYLINRS